jgi:hypothetical protein
MADLLAQLVASYLSSSRDPADLQYLNLTFGVEIEFILAFIRTREWELRYETIKAKGLGTGETRLAELIEMDQERSTIVDSLRGASIPVNDLGEVDSTRWSVESDGSVIPTEEEKEHRTPRFGNGQECLLTEEQWEKLTYCSVEVKSCVLPFNGYSLQEVELVVQTIVKNHAVYVNWTCGLHVHVGNQNFGFPIQTLKNFATLVTCFEQQINEIHPRHRLTSDFCLLESTAFHPEDRSPIRMAEIIDRFETVEDVISRFGVDRNDPVVIQHNWCYNFNNLLWRKDRRTIEFRQHASTLDSAAILRWIRFACTSVSIAHKLPKEILWALVREGSELGTEWDLFTLLCKLDQFDLAASYFFNSNQHPVNMELYDSFLSPAS